MHRQARVTRGQAQPDGSALSLELEVRKRAGSMLFAIKSACPDFWQIFGKRFIDEGMASEKGENHRINTGDFWWAWVDLNHRPRPYQRG